MASEKISANAGIAGSRRKARHYKELLVWQQGMILSKGIYKLTASFPTDERFGLISQMRRAAISVPSNLAEGQARSGTREFLQFVSHSSGSLAELETQILLSIDLGYLAQPNAALGLAEINELQRMIAALRRKLEVSASH